MMLRTTRRSRRLRGRNFSSRDDMLRCTATSRCTADVESPQSHRMHVVPQPGGKFRPGIERAASGLQPKIRRCRDESAPRSGATEGDRPNRSPAISGAASPRESVRCVAGFGSAGPQLLARQLLCRATSQPAEGTREFNSTSNRSVKKCNWSMSFRSIKRLVCQRRCLLRLGSRSGRFSINASRGEVPARCRRVELTWSTTKPFS